jgi:hypothetical protein
MRAGHYECDSCRADQNTLIGSRPSGQRGPAISRKLLALMQTMFGLEARYGAVPWGTENIEVRCS